jgi:prepilin peptidase CpaA
MTFGVPLILLAIGTAFDLRRREIPDWLPVSILGWSVLVTAIHASPHGWLTLATGFVVGCGVGAALYALARFGGGDAKIVAALGALLGAKGLLFLLYYMAFAGGCLAVVALLRKRRDLAYGPAIALGYAALLAVSRGDL